MVLPQDPSTSDLGQDGPVGILRTTRQLDGSGPEQVAAAVLGSHDGITDTDGLHDRDPVRKVQQLPRMLNTRGVSSFNDF